MPAEPATLTYAELQVMARDVGTDAGPGQATRSFNQQLIDAFRAHGGVIPGELSTSNFLLLGTMDVQIGRRRTTPLVYHRIDGRLIVVASTGGGPNNPRWFDQLVATPEARVELGTEAFAARALALAGKDRDAVFAAVVASVPTFGRYQARTSRVIPVVELLRS